MTKGISIHIGLNRVNPDAYEGWDGRLYGCVNDAIALEKVAKSRGFLPTVLLDEHGTSAEVIKAIARAAQDLESGDMLVLTYSGHGAQVDDVNGDEADGKDETWVLYDRMLIDDELYQLWSQFRPEVRIFVLSDSCHSGTVTRDYVSASRARYRVMPTAISAQAYAHRKRMYVARQWAASTRDRSTLDASVIQIAGCQDNQLSLDGDVNGLFTTKLLEVWGGGQFRQDYYGFYKAILAAMPDNQSPNYDAFGRNVDTFAQQTPFTLLETKPPTPNGQDVTASTEAPGSGGPAVCGPAWLSDADAPPHFNITQDRTRFFTFEVTTQAELFDVANHQQLRTPDNFFGSWSEAPHMSGSVYVLPEHVWDRLKVNDALFYRIGTVAGETGWDGYVPSVFDDQWQLAPRIQIEHANGTVNG